MSNQRQIIRKLQKQYSYDEEREDLFFGYKNAIETLSEDLYNKEFHFLYEVIQNADDNDYEVKIPHLSLSLGSVTLEGEECMALSIINNESGFREEDFKAICNIGKSTKKNVFDSIGEKGIGFKSVYRITDCPYIYSGKFAFKLPKYNPDHENGLGYIVPFEIQGHDYENTTTKGTKIILPLMSDLGADKVAKRLLQLSHETILFLRKLKSLEVIIKIKNCNVHRRIERSDQSEFRTLKVTQNDQSFEDQYFLYSRSLDRPSDIHHKKREGVDSRNISVAIPLLKEKMDEGILFSYLPVWENTGLPFMVNADFLLTSNREGIHEDYNWNQWLRDEIAETYNLGFVSLLGSDRVSIDQKVNAYRSIPIEANLNFLDPVVESIHEGLSEMECILSFKTNRLNTPGKVKSPSPNLLKLLDTSKRLPSSISNNNHPLVLDKLLAPELKPILKTIGVQNLGIPDMIKFYLTETSWMIDNEDEWFIQLYEYLRSRKNVTTKFNDIPIVKLEGKSGLFSDKNTNIYFKLYGNPIIDDIPEDIIELLNLSEVSQHLINSYLLGDKSKEKKDWMQENLSIYEFNARNLAFDILNLINKSYEELDSDQIIRLTERVAQLDGSVLHENKIILVLSDDQKFNNEDNDSEVVVPEEYDELAGWQHIYKEDDRDHFRVLSNKYSKECIENLLRNKGNLKRYPSFRKNYFGAYDPTETSAGKALQASIRRKSANDWIGLAKGYEIILPKSLLEHRISKETSKAIVNYLNSFGFSRNYPWSDGIQESQLIDSGLMIKGEYHYRGVKPETVYSSFYTFIKEKPWLYCEGHGFQIPSSVFLDKPEIREILGDSVPYVIDISNPQLIDLLGIKDTITRESLIAYLIDAKKGDVDLKTLIKIYSQLDQRVHTYDDFDASELAQKLIYIETENKWVGKEECIWKDPKDLSGEGEHIALSLHYPESLKTFFVKKMGVAVNLSVEYYIERWKAMQEGIATVDPVVLDTIYKRLKSHIIKRDDACVNEFIEEAEIYCPNRKKFLEIDEVYFADDKKLKSLFDEEISLAYLPRNEGYASWIDFYRSLGVPVLSENVELSIDEAVLKTKQEKAKYLTNPALKLIAAYILTNNQEGYNKFIEQGLFQKLIMTLEYETFEDVSVILSLSNDYIEIEDKRPVYFSLTEHRLLFNKIVDKQEVASVIYDSIKKWIKLPKGAKNAFELYLGEKNLRRKESDGLSTPREVYDLIEQLKDQKERKQESPSELSKEIPESENSNHQNRDQINTDQSEKTESTVGHTDEYEKTGIHNDPSTTSLNTTKGSAQSRTEVHQPQRNGEEGIDQTPPRPTEPRKPADYRPAQYQKPTTKKRRAVSDRSDNDQSTTSKLQSQGKKLDKEIEKNEQKKQYHSLKERLAEQLKDSQFFSFGWLKLLTELEYLYDVENSNQNGYNLTFNKVEVNESTIYLDIPNRYVSSHIEQYEDLKLVLYTEAETITLSIQSVSVNKYAVRAKLWKKSDLKSIDVNKVEKAVLKIDSVDFLWKVLLDQLSDIASVKGIEANDLLIELIKDYRISFIFGPPGTGKTTTLVRDKLIPSLNKNSDKILVLAPTNKAADVITRKLIDQNVQGNFYRYGNTGDESLEKHSCYVTKTLKYHQKAYTLITTIARFPYDMISFENGDSPIALREEKWDKVIVDEASMINLAQIIGLILSLDYKTEFVIVGDPFQIKPILKIPEWKESNIYDLVGLMSFNTDKTPQNNYPVRRLMTQYRSLIHIGGLYGEYSYHGKLKSHRGNLGKPKYKLFNEESLKCLNVVKFPINQDSTLYSSKYLNKSSYHLYLGLFMMEWLIQFTKNLGNESKSIGIISPYKAHSDLLFKLVNANHQHLGGHSIQISTVHGFQGDECDIIICAFNPPKSTSPRVSLNDKNIINVAISRAKDHLILFIPENYRDFEELSTIVKLVTDRSHKEFEAKDIEADLFKSTKYIDNISYATAHHPINVFGSSQYKYEIRIEEDALDIQINENSIVE